MLNSLLLFIFLLSFVLDGVLHISSILVPRSFSMAITSYHADEQQSSVYLKDQKAWKSKSTVPAPDCHLMRSFSLPHGET